MTIVFDALDGPYCHNIIVVEPVFATGQDWNHHTFEEWIFNMLNVSETIDYQGIPSNLKSRR